MSKSDPKRAARRKPSAKAAAPRKKTTARKAASPPAPDIEEAWRYVDRFCRALWVKHVQSEPAGSLAELIIALRDRDVVPVHETNMMHTIRSLRNQVVHENVDFGEHETTIAQAAWHIIRAWAEATEAEAWLLTVNVCAKRAA
jgi:hypothetical protein